MSSLDLFLAKLRGLKINLSVDGDQLVCRAPKGVMTSELSASITAQKVEIIDFLKSAKQAVTKENKIVKSDSEPTLSFSQNRLWFLYELEGPSSTYNMPLGLKLQGDFDRICFENALNKIIERHESLRSNFYKSPTGPKLAIAKQKTCSIDWIDLLSDPTRDVKEIIAQFNQTTFNLSSDLLIRALIIRTKPDTHYVFILLHHIIADGWSIGVLFDELRTIYSALVEGSPVSLSPIEIQYSDYSKWLEEELKGDRLEALLSYWKTNLANCPDCITLFTDHPRPNHLSYSGNTAVYQLSTSLSNAIKDLAQASNCTLYMALLAGFSILLANHSNQDDLVIGSPVANRNQTDIEKLIGLFINTLPLRFNLSSNPTVTELLGQVRKTCIEGFDHQEIPFEKIVEEINPPRSLNHAPLYQVSFDLQTKDPKSSLFAGLKIENLDPENTSAKFDLSLTITDENDGLSCDWNYANDLFSLDTIELMAQRFDRLLTQMVANPNQHIRDINLLGENEKRQFLDQIKNTQFELPPIPTFLDQITQHALSMPDRIAVSFENACITYQELDLKSTKFALKLAAMKVRPEDFIGIYVNRSIDMVIALLGVLKSGAAYIPLDPNFPVERLSWIIEDSNPLFIITEANLGEKLKLDRTKILLLDSLVHDPLPQEAELSLKNTILPLNIAYVIFTSGSTGRPKGVQVTHQSLLNFLCSMQKSPGFDKENKLLAVTTLSFDIAGLEIFLPLFAGGEVVIASRETAIDGRQLQKVILNRSITTMQATPATWKILLDTAWQPPLPFNALCGGEALPNNLSQSLLSQGLNLWNLYGPTETTIWSAAKPVNSLHPFINGVEPIGSPIFNTQLYVTKPELDLLSTGLSGELNIGGIGLARGYLQRPALTAESYRPDPYSIFPGSRLYGTGDLVRQNQDGYIQFLGRKDFQVKIRGYRIEVGEIESLIQAHPNTKEVLVMAKGSNNDSNMRLIAYLIPKDLTSHSDDVLRTYLKKTLPEYMVPAQIVTLDQFPLTPNGKIDRKALPAPNNPKTTSQENSNLSNRPTEKLIRSIWQEVLELQQISIDDNFFDLGGHSLLLTSVNEKLRVQLGQDIPLITLFEYPTIRTLADWLNEGDASKSNADHSHLSTQKLQSNAIAIIGMAARFPGADNLATFWENLKDGKESIRFFSEAELLSAGIEPELIASPNYIRGTGTLSNITDFDAEFFSYIPAEAKFIDPQQRIFLETTWQALENAGYAQSKTSSIGVFAGVGHNDYLIRNIVPYVQSGNDTSVFQLIIGNDKDFLATRVSYAFNLTGPSITLQTACSTSLVAIHSACRSLIDGECEMALAGGVAIKVPHISGYLHEEGMISSRDGHCRAFDEHANGTVWGSGAGVVLLKPLDKVIEDRDTIHAVIKGSSINNDGSAKVGFTAPSVAGQLAVIKQALANADVAPDSISYIETHGTGTDLGDLIEITALKEVFPTTESNNTDCAIGSVKTNIGHLNTAAGIAGLSKTVLALQHKQIPPTLHFQKANPKLGLEKSRFYVPTEIEEWAPKNHPRRAGISSFGIGGTNAHVILEEAPPKPTSHSRHQWQIIPFSAKTPTALKLLEDEFSQYLKSEHPPNLEDIAYTLAVGRKHFPYRTSFVCKSVDELILALEETDLGATNDNIIKSSESPQVVFLFPGQGTQFIGMGENQYRDEPLYRDIIDYCSEYLEPILGLDLRQFIIDSQAHSKNIDELINETWITQPCLFITEYALAKLWMSWGVQPDAMIGHSLGEYVAACLSGVIELDTALTLVCQRGRLMWSAPQGSMLAISQSASEVNLRSFPDLSIAAVNLEHAIVVAGPEDSINELANILEKSNIAAIKLQTSHAFHSSMMDCILDEFKAYVEKQQFSEPTIPYISNISGSWVTELEVKNSEYWIDHLRSTVQFSKGLDTLLTGENLIFLELGPKAVLSSLVKKKAANKNIKAVIPCLNTDTFSQEQSSYEALVNAWKNGVHIVWSNYYAQDQLSRIPLPTYPFERKRHWIDAPAPGSYAPIKQLQGRRPLDEWFYLPHWRPTISPAQLDLNIFSKEKRVWLILANESALCRETIEFLSNLNQEVITVSAGEKFIEYSAEKYVIAPLQENDYISLISKLQHISIYKILDFWSFDDQLTANFKEMIPNLILSDLAVGFFSLIYLSKALAKLIPADKPIDITVIANRLHDVYGNGKSDPIKSTLIGPSLVIPQEVPQITVHCLDLETSNETVINNSETISKILSECENGSIDPMVAYRGNQRMVPSYQQVELKASFNQNPILRNRGVYLITGGLGRVGLLIAQYLNQQVKARLCLISRTELPPREEWSKLCQHDSPLKETLLAILQLEESGSEVLILSADVADLQSIEKAFLLCKASFGVINGIFHAAGLPSLVAPFLDLTPAIVKDQFAAKIDGTFNLKYLLDQYPVDFCNLVSSTSAVLGGLGYAAYSAANIFLDHFASVENNHQNHTRWLSINWDAWNFSKVQSEFTQALEFSMTPTESMTALDRVLRQQPSGRMIIATGDLEARFKNWVIREDWQENTLQISQEQHTRPELDNLYVAPTSATEISLTQIWQSLLGYSEIGINDNFFDLGGDSMLAIRLMSAIKVKFGRQLALTILLDKPNIKELAELMDITNNQGSSTPLVALQPMGTLTPIFCIPGTGGSVLYLRSLANEFIKWDRPFYGLQAILSPDTSKPIMDIHEIARLNIKAIQTIQSDGPYQLCGHSFGSWVALEMAFQLQEAGHQVSQLIILDTGIPSEKDLSRISNWDDCEWLILVSKIIGDTYNKTLNLKLEELRELNWEGQIDLLFSEMKANDLIEDASGIEEVRSLVEMYKAQAQTMYTPRALKVPNLALIRAKTLVDGFLDGMPAELQNDPFWGWGQFSQSMPRLEHVPGTHLTMVQPPNAQALGMMINEIMKNSAF